MVKRVNFMLHTFYQKPRERVREQELEEKRLRGQELSRMKDYGSCVQEGEERWAEKGFRARGCGVNLGKCRNSQ